MVKTNGATYQYTKTVLIDHIDALNHVNNVVYIEWINEISENHWELLSNNKLNLKYFWVVLKHDVDYFGQALLGDELVIKTQVKESVGVKSIREVEIYKGNKLLVKGKTTWCLIDAQTQKPKRINTDIFKILYPEL